VTEQPANEPEPEGRQEWAESNAESNEVTPDEDRLHMESAIASNVGTGIRTSFSLSDLSF
jgi:hypothetical protein